MHRRTIFILIIASVLIFMILELTGVIWHNDWLAADYEVKGLDISHHQGVIDWKTVQEKNEFAFIYMKATEGHDFIDPRFKTNWEEAQNQGFRVGAYHFFSMRSPGKVQASNFIQTVPVKQETLPPVIDIEIHLKHDPGKVRQELQSLADELEKHYRKRPIFYVTYDTYEQYIKGYFEDYDLWIRDIFKHPALEDRNWLIWQYSCRERVDGIDGFVDINAFHGNWEAFKKKFLIHK
ncbi:MAG: GH25 family lysozyme [Thermoactinomyces sp.]